MPSVIQTLRSYEKSALASGGTLNVAEAKQLKALATTPEAKQVLADILARDAFEPGARAVLAGPAAKAAEKPSGLTGTTLGTVAVAGTKVNVTVTRELSPTAGYANKWQAVGAARASGERNTAVILDGKSPARWHAVQTNILATPSKDYAPVKTKLQEVAALTLLPTGAEFTSMNAAALAAKTAWKKDPSAENFKAAQDAYVTLASRTYGVAPGEINVIDKTTDMDPKKINVMLNIPHGQAYFGNAKGDVDAIATDGSANAPHGVVLGTSGFRSQVQASGLLAHESTHKEHFELAADWVAQWKASGTAQKLGPWLEKQPASKLTADQREVIHEQVANKATTQSELSAYVNELAVTFPQYPAGEHEAKATFDAIKQRLGALGGDDTQTLKALYASLDEAHRKVYAQHLPVPK